MIIIKKKKQVLFPRNRPYITGSLPWCSTFKSTSQDLVNVAFQTRQSIETSGDYKSISDSAKQLIISFGTNPTSKLKIRRRRWHRMIRLGRCFESKDRIIFYSLVAQSPLKKTCVL